MHVSECEIYKTISLKVNTDEVKIIDLRKPSSSQPSTVLPWTPVWPQEQNSAPSTYRRIIPPRLKSDSKQKRVGENSKTLLFSPHFLNSVSAVKKISFVLFLINIDNSVAHSKIFIQSDCPIHAVVAKEFWYM